MLPIDLTTLNKPAPVNPLAAWVAACVTWCCLWTGIPLAVKLRMRLRIDDYGAAARIDDKGAWHACEAHLHGGIAAATRRAITRAAASIGSKS